MPLNAESPTTEQTAAEYLKSTDIGKEKKYTEYLDKLWNQNTSKEQANALKNDEIIVSGMENLFKSKIDLIVSKGEHIDDNDAKMLIAYDALKDRYLEKKLPNNETERKTVALRIADQINNIKKFDTHKDKDRYYDFMTETYRETKSDNTIDLNVDGIKSIDTGNTAINDFIAKNNTLQKYLIFQKKQDCLNVVMNATRSMHDEIDSTSQGTLLHKQASDKLTSLRQENRNVRDSMKILSSDPKQCMELAELFKNNKESFNTPANKEMVNMKDIFMDLATNSYTTKKESNSLYRYRNDLRRDNGISTDQNGNIVKSPAGLKANTISLVDIGGKISVKNNVTHVSLDITDDMFTKWAEHNKTRENNRTEIEKYRASFEEKYMKDNNLTKESLQHMTDQEQRKIEQDMNIAMITEVFTKDEKLYTIFMTETEREQDWPQSLRGEWMGKIFNTILTKINWGELVGFDSTIWRTTWEIKGDTWKKYIELKQGKSLIKLGFDKILGKTIDIRSQAEKQKDEATEQEKLSQHSPTTIDTYEAKDRVPDLRRALDEIDHPSEGENWLKHINLSDLNLTDKDVSFLSSKLSDIKENTTINLWNNVIEHAPKNIFTMEHITGINLTNNNLESLPKIQKESKLTSLNISQNSFDYFPEITQFKKLSLLNISWNNILDISDITALDLTKLNANNIGLRTLPANIWDMKNLQEFSLDNNKLTDLPKDFDKLTAITNLSLSSNDLKWPISLSQCPNMKTLNVSNNKDMLDFPIVGNNTNIKNIYCYNTNIKTIPTWLEKQCPNLKNIEIYKNIITWKEAINQFLDGSLTMNWYEFKQDGQKKETSAIKTFFNPDQKFKYLETSGNNENDAIQQAKSNLWSDIATANITYAIKTSSSGAVNIYMFIQAEKNRDWL